MTTDLRPTAEDLARDLCQDWADLQTADFAHGACVLLWSAVGAAIRRALAAEAALDESRGALAVAAERIAGLEALLKSEDAVSDELLDVEDNRKADDVVFERAGPTAAAWHAFGRWLERWRRAHSDDDRTDLDLIDTYHEETSP